MSEAVQAFGRATMIDRILNKCCTGNSVLDTFISLALVDSGVAKNLGQWLATNAPRVFWRLVHMIVRLWRYVRWRLGLGVVATDVTTKQCEVRSITPGMEINTVFPKLQWYLRELTDVNAEPVLHIQQGKGDLDLVQDVPRAHNAKITFQGIEVEYSCKSEVITIHADRDYRREVHIIQLKALGVAPKHNLFRELVDVAQLEYEKAAQKKAWRQQVYRNVESSWKGTPAPHPRRLDTIVLRDGLMTELCNDFDDFLNSESWYLDRSVAYSRGYMFFGQPGTGKSSTIQAFAARAKRDIHYLMLSSVQSDEQLFQLLKEISFKNTILVIEDIDCASDVTHARQVEEVVDDDAFEDKEPPKRLTLSGLLQAFDSSVMDTHGRIIIITTNHARVLDPALVRAGRIDMKVHFDNCTASQVGGLYTTFFSCAPPSALTDDQVRHLSPADVAGLFVEHKKNPLEAWDALVRGYAPVTCE